MPRILLLRFAAMLLGVTSMGCQDSGGQPADYDFPTVLPIWIVEDDPKETIYLRKDLERDRKVGKMLVIPLYLDYRHERGTDHLAIAHPFVYEQGADIEKHLASFAQRDKLRRLVFWVPGYFPDGMGRTFPWIATINEREMIVLELQRCLGAEESQINAAMKTLLDGDFTVGGDVALRPPPPPYKDEARMSDDRYDASQVVRSREYTGRFFNITLLIPHGAVAIDEFLGRQFASRLLA